MAVTVSPSSVTVKENATQQFTASTSSTWTTNCGSISSTGLFKAPLYPKVCTITATGKDGSGTATASVNVISTITMNPVSVVTPQGQTQQFTASAPVTWTAACGSITSGGLYTASASVGKYCTVEGIATTSPKYTVYGYDKIGPPSSTQLTISPANPTITEAATQQFTASAPATFSATCGAISSAGLYTAPLVPGPCTITATGSGASASTTATIVSPVSITPASAQTPQGQTQQFSASAPVTWSATCGAITSSGLFTASGAAGSLCMIEAIATSPPQFTAFASDTIASTGFSIVPSNPTVFEGATQQFSVGAGGTWKTNCGSISSSGLFKAPLYPKVCTITVTATSGGQAATTNPNVVSPIVMTPVSAITPQGQTQQFTASAPVTWTAGCGSITSNGLYTASAPVGKFCTVEGIATTGPKYTVYGFDQIGPAGPPSSLAITPSAVNLHALNTQAFTASQPVNWSTTCGSVSSDGLFTAPASAATCTLTATATDGSGASATTAIYVDVANYTAWKGGGGTTGANTSELVLTPSNVNAGSFGKLWSVTVDGAVNAQPLYMNALTINGAPRNVVFVVTADDSVYALDGDTGAQLWQVSLIPAGATAVPASAVDFTSATEIGILSTPVIDPSSNTMYVVTETAELNSGMGPTYFPHRLHALDLATGAEKFGGPVLVSDPSMPPVHKLQRPGLLLAHGNVYVSIGSMQDEQPFHGVMFAFDAQSLAQQAVWVVTPTGIEGGIWMAGAAPSVDSGGNIYVATGNGTFDGATNFGEAAVKLSPTLQVLDYFAPYNWSTYDASNLDLGSGNAMVVPDQTGPYPHELIVCGKPTPIYVLNRDNLGQVGSSSGPDNIIQRLDNAVGRPGPNNPNSVSACYTTPAMLGHTVYFGGKYDVLKAFNLDPATGLLSSSPTSQGNLAYGYPGANPVVSANGFSNGIVWAIDTGTSTLRANDAENLANELYSGSISGPLRFSAPTVVNAHVYVGTQNTVFAFGLLNN